MPPFRLKKFDPVAVKTVVLVTVLGLWCLLSVTELGARRPQEDSLAGLLRDAAPCRGSGSPSLQTRARAYFSEPELSSRLLDCDLYFARHGAPDEEVSEAEREFPLAFGHSVHTQVGLLELYLLLHFRDGLPEWTTVC